MILNSSKTPSCKIVLMVSFFLILCFYSTFSYADDGFVADEILVTRDYIFDAEFDYQSSRFAWTDPTDGNVWIGNVDPTNGDFSPPDGKDVLIDINAFFLNNGPEWVGNRAEEPRIVYTRRFGRSGDIVGMAEAKLINGSWTANILPNSKGRIGPIASLEPNDPNPVILYMDFYSNSPQILGWRFLNDPMTEHHVPSTAGSHGGRWVPGRRAIVYTKQFSEGGERQAFHYSLKDNKVQQLTFDAGVKEAIFMWKAPEFNNEYVYFVSVRYNGASEIRVYRKWDSDNDGTEEWAVFNTIRPPSPGIFLWSPEPFVHNGKSYIFTMATREEDRTKNSLPKQIWILGINPEEPFFRNLSDPYISRVRLDPEVIVLDQGPVVYYNSYIPGPDVDIFVGDKGYEGIYRVDTGLGPLIP